MAKKVTQQIKPEIMSEIEKLATWQSGVTTWLRLLEERIVELEEILEIDWDNIKVGGTD